VKRIIRVGIEHEGTFRYLLRVVRRAQACHRFGGRYWELIHREDGVSIYRLSQDSLQSVQERVESCETELYRSLASGYVGRDGRLRARTTNVLREGGGVYRQRRAILATNKLRGG